MNVHHLNCGTLRPLGGRRVNGDEPPWRAARMVCHCLLIEADRGLVLVDSGFGLEDLERLGDLRSSFFGGPAQLARYGYSRLLLRPPLDPAETAVRQVAALGHSPADVTDVVVTHLDLDHAGGLPDFPRARVHVSQAEHDFALGGASGGGPVQSFRYWAYQWAHGPDWVTYGDGGDRWLEFDGVRELDGLPGIAFVPLPGHSAGQCGVAVRVDAPPAAQPAGSPSGESWLLHAADAYFDHREIDPVAPRSTPGSASFQKTFQFDGDARRDSRARLRELARAHADKVEIFCTHDPVELDRYAAAAAAAGSA